MKQGAFFSKINIAEKPLVYKTGVWLFLSTLLLLFALEILTVPFPIVGVIIVVGLVLFWPGWLLAYWLRTLPESWLEQAILAFCLSIGLWSLLAVPLLLFHSNLTVFIWLVTSVTLLLALLTLFQGQPHPQTNPQSDSPVPQLDKSSEWPHRIYLGALLLALIVLLIIFVSTTFPTYRWDRVLYQAFLRHYLDAEQFLTKGFRISEQHILMASRELFQPWVLLQALIIKLAQVDLLDTYVYYIPPLLVPLSFIALYTLGKELFGNASLALIACLVQVLYIFSDAVVHEGVGLSFFQRLTEDKFLIRFILLPVILWFTLLYLKQGGWGNLISLVVMMFAIGLVHPMGIIMYGLSFGLFFSVKWILSPWPEKKKEFIRILPIMAIVLLIALIPLWQRYQMASSEFGAKFFELENGIRFSERLVILSETPLIYIAASGLISHPLVILAILLTPLFLKYLRTHLSAQFLFANMAGILIVCFTPGLTTLVGKAVTPAMIWRILWILPIPLVLAFFLGELRNRTISYFNPTSRFWDQLIPLCLILVGAFLFQTKIRAGFDYLKSSQENNLVDGMNGIDILLYLREHGEPGSVIMAPTTRLANEIPGIVGHSYGITFRTAPTLFEEAPDDQSSFYQSALIIKTHLDLLKKYNAHYVILEKNALLNRQFERMPHIFRLLYTNQDYVLYQSNPESASQAELAIIEANGYQQQSDLVNAEKVYLKVFESDSHPLAALELGRLYLGEDKIAEARALYERALAATPDDPWLYFYLAETYIAQGELTGEIQLYREASVNYHRALDLAPDDLNIRRVFVQEYLDVGAEYFDSSLIDEGVIEVYQREVDRRPEKIQTYWSLAEVYQTVGQPDKAIAVYNAIAERWPQKAETYLYLGQLYEVQGEIDVAMTSYQRAIDLSPSLSRAYIRLGDLYRSQNEMDKAIALYQTAAQYNDDSAWPHIELGKIYLENVNEAMGKP